MSVMTDLFRGRGAHADSLACFAGIDAEMAGRPIAGTNHTIWKELWHINYWLDYELRSIAGPEVPYPEHAAASWPETIAPPSAEAFEVERRRLAELIERFIAIGKDDAIGGRVVHPAKGETVRDVCWQMIAHNSYHLGQVVQIRRVFGAWPPPEGGDTW